MTEQVFLSIDGTKIGPWRASRIYMACRWFAHTLASNCDIKASYLDHTRVGWTFWMPTEDTRDKLVAYYDMIMQAPT